MARIDAFIDRLFQESGRELRLETGAGAVVSAPRGPVRLLKQPLTTPQIVGAVAEIVPPERRAGFPRPGVTAFPYLARAGAVEVRFETGATGVRVVVMPRPPGHGDPGAPPAARSPAAPPPPAPPVPRAAPTPAPSPAAAPTSPVAAANRDGSIPAPQDPRAALDALLEAMLARRASDLHLTAESPPTFRIDGDMVPEVAYGPIAHERLKELLWSIAPEKNREEWHARKDTDFAHETAAARFRVNVFADRKGIGAVLRQIPNEILTAEKMGLSQPVLDLCFLTKGLVLVTGPTGSGKSTTLAAMVDYINRNRDDHIITIEDPIEFVHPNKRCLVNQREIGTHTSSFKQALRAALREDPDIVLVGEMRDLETIAIAIETAETGHLVFGTLHTNTAPSTVDRIIDQFPSDRQAQIRMMLSESLRGVISQTLCKRIGGGRVPALEILLCTSSVSNLIREGKTFQIPSMMQTGRGAGMATLNDALLDLVKRKVVEPREAYAKAVAKGELKTLLERAGVALELGAG
ncbi:type IV pilus twitching motility protein PilT [Anaeromyxobacter oryzisoli]|uniref:type IV pilus twitching motility protein PilT n=1 Tax=Anaeromyxobacter oryzisoli TaxID=2925408 RepID=UPI00241326D3|nr:type IV pilus twitching motility protein PilT [Anaeromyxobacter sp. SG63]